MINTLQLIAFLPLFNISMPYNVQTFFIIILQTLNFNLIDLDTANSYLFGNDESEAYTELFDLVGFGSKNFIDNLGQDLYIIFLFLGALLIAFIAKALKKHKYAHLLYEYLSKKLIFSFILRLLLEGYLAFFFSSLI